MHLLSSCAAVLLVQPPDRLTGSPCCMWADAPSLWPLFETCQECRCSSPWRATQLHA